METTPNEMAEEALKRAELANKIATSSLNIVTAYGAVIKSLLAGLRDTGKFSAAEMLAIFESALVSVDRGEPSDEHDAKVRQNKRHMIGQIAAAVGVQLPSLVHSPRDKLQ